MPPAFSRRQILASGRMVHATDTFQTACFAHVLPGATSLPDDTPATCPTCLKEPSLKLMSGSVPAEQIARHATVHALTPPWLGEYMHSFDLMTYLREYGYRDPEAAEKAHASFATWLQAKAAFDALQEGLLLGRHARGLMTAAGLPALLAGAAGPAEGK